MRNRLAALATLGLLVAAAPVASAVPGSADTAGGDRVAAAPAERAGQAALERKVIRLTNKRRVAHDCDRLGMRKSLRKAARKHSDAMADADELSHQVEGEPPLGERVSNAGYDWTMVGENIAVGYRTPRAVVKAWMKSEGHRANILDCDYEHIGVGVVTRDGTRWWTQVFGAN